MSPLNVTGNAIYPRDGWGTTALYSLLGRRSVPGWGTIDALGQDGASRDALWPVTALVRRRR